MTKVKENLERIKVLEEDRERIDKEISDIKKEISDEYFDYLKEVIETIFGDESYVKVYSSFYHFGKFKGFGWLGTLGAKRKKGYANDYDIYFEFIDGFRTDISCQNSNGFEINNIQNSYNLFPIGIDTDIQDGVLYTKDTISILTKEEYEKIYNEEKNTYIYYTTEATAEDSNGKIIHTGDKVSYMSNRKGPYVGKVSMITGKKVYIEKGCDAHFANKVIKID